MLFSSRVTVRVRIRFSVWFVSSGADTMGTGSTRLSYFYKWLGTGARAPPPLLQMAGHGGHRE